VLGGLFHQRDENQTEEIIRDAALHDVQTALLNAPLTVIVGWGMGKDMGLNFEIFMVVLLVLTFKTGSSRLRALQDSTKCKQR
jgi:Ca2+:H+ antiporter